MAWSRILVLIKGIGDVIRATVTTAEPSTTATTDKKKGKGSTIHKAWELGEHTFRILSKLWSAWKDMTSNCWWHIVTALHPLIYKLITYGHQRSINFVSELTAAPPLSFQLLMGAHGLDLNQDLAAPNQWNPKRSNRKKKKSEWNLLSVMNQRYVTFPILVPPIHCYLALNNYI